MQCDTEVEWGPGTADQEDTNTPLRVLPHRPLEVLLTTLWRSEESSEQSVVPHTTPKTSSGLRLQCALTRGLGYNTARQPSCRNGSADRGSSSKHNSPFDSVSYSRPPLDPARVPHLSPTAQLLTGRDYFTERSGTELGSKIRNGTYIRTGRLRGSACS